MPGTSPEHRVAAADKRLKKQGLLNIGFGNFVVMDRVVAIVNPSSSPMRRLREDAAQEKLLVNATQGRKTRSIIVADSGHVFLSAIQAETIGARFSQEEE